MLPSDLLRVRRSGMYAKPRFADAADGDVLHLASDLLEIYSSGQGMSFETLHALAVGRTALERDVKLAKGLLHVIEADADFSSVCDHDYPSFRRDVFQKGASMIRSSSLPASPEDVRSSVMKACPGAPDALLYGDLPENAVLSAPPGLFPREVIERYNVSLVSTLLLSASNLKVCFPAGSDPQLLRGVFRYMKFFRLMVSAEERPDKSLVLTIDGPASVLENTRKYGFQLASFFPIVCRVPGWKIRSDVELDGKKFVLNLDSSSGLKSHYKNFSSYSPEEFKLFSAYFNSPERKTGEKIAWKANDAPGFLKIAPQKIIFPDFAFVSGGRMVRLELFHRWHASQLAERITFCEKHPIKDYFIGVDRALLKKDGEVKAFLETSSFFQKAGFLFRDFPGAENVEKILNGLQ